MANPVAQMVKSRFLSYSYKKTVPVYGNAAHAVEIREERSMAKGDTCDTAFFTLKNHWGTHIDCPAHFFTGAKSVTDYSAEFFHFRNPQVLKVHLAASQLVEPEDLSGIRKETDILLLQSGWGKDRGKDIYSSENPGVSAETGKWLRECYPNLRMIGFDWISLSAYQRREEGRIAHRAFLDPKAGGQPVLIIEDMDLSGSLYGLKEVFIAPLRLEGLDGAPVTVIGVFHD